MVLDTLNPAERLAFVLHDLFAIPFDEIAPIVGRSPTATRQLASRARRRVQGATADSDVDLTHQRKVVEAFLTASHSGDFEALLAVLDSDVILKADRSAIHMGAPGEVRSAADVARQFSGRARAAQTALVNGAIGLVWASGGHPRVVFDVTITGVKIVTINMLANPESLHKLNLTLLNE